MTQQQVFKHEVLARAHPGQDGREQQPEKVEHPLSIADLCSREVLPSYNRGFLQFLIDTNSAGWFGYVIVFGELAVGVGLILGAFVGLAAAGGLLMNMAFLLAVTTNTNPVLVILGMLLILAWKNAGYIGLDYFLLPRLRTPWKQTAKLPAVAPAPRPTAAAVR